MAKNYAACFSSTCPLVPCISAQMLSCRVWRRVCGSASFTVRFVRALLFVVARCRGLVLVFRVLIAFFVSLVGLVCELASAAAVWVKARLMSLWI